MKVNENTIVKIPAFLHLTHLEHSSPALKMDKSVADYPAEKYTSYITTNI